MATLSTISPLFRLSDSEASVLNDLPVAVYACDRSGAITFYNLAATALWGRKPVPEDLWNGADALYYPDGRPMQSILSPMARSVATGHTLNGEEIIVGRRDGNRLNVLSYPVPRFNNQGEVIGAVNTLIDITAQKQGETKDSVLAAIITSSDDAIISKNLDGIINSWNQSAEKIYGYTEAEAIGRHISLIIPEDRLDEETVIIDKIRAGERVDHFETWRKTKTGEILPVSLTISPVKDAKGNIVGASKVARDITRLKSDEAMLNRYAEKLETLNDIGKLVSESLDIDNILQTVTDVTTKLSGAAFGAFFYNRVDEKGESYMLYTLSGAPKEAFGKFGMPRNTEVFHPTFTGEGIVRVDDITKDPRYGKNAPHLGMPKGHLPVVSYLAVPVLSKDGNVIGGLFFGHPEPGRFTEEHEQIVSGVVTQAAIALDNAKLYDEIIRLNAKKDEFIGMASHELRTPVTSLKGYLQIFSRNLSESDQNKKYIDNAIKQVNKLSSLISDLLDVSKIETGKLPLNFSEFDLRQLIHEAVDLMQYSSKSHRIVFLADENTLLVNADRQRIEQVLINLISNAIKYSPGANEVSVTMSKKQGGAHVEIRDYGIGIPIDEQRRVFSRFYRVDELAAHISGLGIGLYISKEIINRHKGQLDLVSKPGEGSTFWFDLPVYPQAV